MNTKMIKSFKIFFGVCFLFVFASLITEVVWGATYGVSRDSSYNILPDNKTYTFQYGLNVTGNLFVSDNVTADYFIGLFSPTGDLNMNGYSIYNALDLNSTNLNTGTATVTSITDGTCTITAGSITAAVDVNATGKGNFATVNTGQGDNELYDMNQNVQTTDAVTFDNVTASSNFYGDLNASYIQNEYWVDIAGDTMTGNLAMGSNNITGIDYCSANYFQGDGSGLTNVAAVTANSSTYWDDETSQADLNVNSSNYWDSLDTPLDILTMGNFTGETIIATLFSGPTDFSTLYNVSAACPSGSAVTNLSYPVTCTTFAGTGDCGAGTVAQNTTTSGVECLTVVEAESDPVYGANTYAVDMDQNVATDSAVSFTDITSTGATGINVTTGCVYLPSGGSLCGNSTCIYLTSPDTTTVMQACNT